MDALFERLEHEHRTIREVLSAFDRFLVAAAESPTPAHRADVPRFLIFFREYVDLVHHEREERVLLPALARHGFAAKFGPSAHVKDQHGHERHLVHELFRHALRQGGCEPNDPEFVRLAREFLTFQMRHIDKEDEFLYPTAKKELKDENAILKNEVDKFDTERNAYGRLAWLERMVGEFTTVYPPA